LSQSEIGRSSASVSDAKRALELHRIKREKEAEAEGSQYTRADRRHLIGLHSDEDSDLGKAQRWQNKLMSGENL